MQNKKLTLIQQLLAKAESTTPEEAEALTAAAEKLMVRHGIDQAMIDARRAADERPESVVQSIVRFEGDHGIGFRLMATQVAEALGLRTLYRSKGRWWQEVYLIGFESDVEQAKILLASLQLQATVAMRAWWRGEDYELHRLLTQAQQRLAKRTFLVGFGQGAADRIRYARDVAARAADAEASSGPSTEIVLRDRAAAVDTWIGEKYPKLGKGRGVGVGSHGRAEGRAAGRAANTGDKAVGGSRAALGA